MNIFFPFLGILTKGDSDGKGGGDPVKQYYSKEIGYNRWVRMFT
jgi:hypothetical protein